MKENTQNQLKTEAYESERIIKNLLSLRHNPVVGNFDEKHLSSIHERVFSGTSIAAGKFREEVASGEVWKKERVLSKEKINYDICYSPMDTYSKQFLKQTLERINIKKLKSLDKHNFVNEIGSIYSQLDYIHPFNDGNSRTLREFTSQIAKESGYSIEWSRLKEEKDFERLYRARDIEVSKINQQKQLDTTVKSYSRRLEKYIDNGQGMASILHEITRPERARAFQHEKRENALAKHPELEKAYFIRDKAATYSVINFKRQIEREKFIELMNNHIQSKLDTGEVSNFKPTEKQKENIFQQVKKIPDKER